MDLFTTLTALVFFFLLFCYSHAETTRSRMVFKCSRPTSPCMNSGVCPETSDQCVCASGFRGQRCDVLLSTMDLGALSCLEGDPCVKGQCYDRGGGQGAACLCTEDYYGHLCHLARFDVDCHDDRMVIYLLPWGYDVSSWDLSYPYLVNTPAAILDTISRHSSRNPDFAVKDRQGFVGEFLHVEDPAGSSATVEFQNETAITYSRTVYVSYYKPGGHPTDETLTASCTVPYVPKPKPTSNSLPQQTTTTTTTTTTAKPPPSFTFSPPGGNWSCQRVTTPCLGRGSECSLVTGKCRCTAGTIGLQCTVPEDKIQTGECSFSTLNPCSPKGGVCYDNGYGAQCACLDGYYGSFCQHPMVTTECLSGKMLINVFPYGYKPSRWPSSLRPVLFPSGKCPMRTVREMTSAQPELTSKGWEGFADVFWHVNDPCAGNATIVSENAEVRVYSRQVEVRYSTEGYHITDNLFTFTCQVQLSDHPLPTPLPPPDKTTESKPPTTTTATTTTTSTTTTTTTTPVVTQTEMTTTPPPPPTTTTTTTTTKLPTTVVLATVRPDQLGNVISDHLGQGQMTSTSATQGQSTSTSQAQGQSTSTSQAQGQATSTSQARGHTTSGYQKQPQLPRPYVKTTFLDEDAKVLRGAVKLGSLVIVVFDLQPLKNNKNVTDLRVESCVVTEERTGRVLSVVKHSCPSRPMGLMLFKRKKGTSILIIKMMKFPSSVKLHFSCQVALCTPRDKSCSQVYCPYRFARAAERTGKETARDVSLVETTLIGY